MSLFDSRLFSWLQPAPRQAALKSPRALAGARRRRSSDSGEPLFSGSWAVLSPPTPDQTWRLHDLDTETLSAMPADRLLELLADLSPEISRALWDWLRFCNPGYEVTVTVAGTDDIHAAGTAAVAAFLDELRRHYQAVDVPINRLFLGAFLRGAFFAELVLDNAGRRPLDLATPDPSTARFAPVTDRQRGRVWQLGQYQNGEWVALDYPTVAYVPIDPLPGSPYGRAPVAPAMFTAIFLTGLLHDLRRVIAQQGYPRLDLSVNLERLRAAMPANLEDTEFEGWVNSIIDEIQDVYNELEPDDAYVHTDVVEIGRPVGTVGGDSLGGIDGILRGLERMITRALKTMPLLMGSNEAVSETHANRQWEIHAAGIKALQHLAENLLERLLTVALEAQGIMATVTWRFAELRASEALRDAQTEAVLIDNAIAKYQAGWISQDEAAQAVTGHAADAPAPRVVDLGGRADLVTAELENA